MRKGCIIILHHALLECTVAYKANIIKTQTLVERNGWESQ